MHPTYINLLSLCPCTKEIPYLGTGIVRASALYSATGPEVEGTTIHFDLVDVTPGVDGKRKTYGGRRGPGDINAPAGDYVLAARLEEAEIMSGLSAGQVLVVTGFQDINEGEALQTN